MRIRVKQTFATRVDDRKGLRMQAPVQRLEHSPAAPAAGARNDPAPPTPIPQGRIPWVKPRADVVETGMEVTAYLAAD